MAMPAPLDPRALGSGLPAAVLDQLPDDGQRYEVVRGDLLVTPAPDPWHQSLAARVNRALDRYLEHLGSAEVRFAPIEAEHGPDSRVQPDLLVVPAHLVYSRPRYQLADLLLVVEILSPSTARTDRGNKRRLYQQAGIPQYWIVDPGARIVEVWTPTADSPVIERERLTWLAPGAEAPLLLDLSRLFTPG